MSQDVTISAVPFAPCNQRESLIEPTRDTAGHDLDRAPQSAQPNGSPRSPVAMRPCAVHHEQRLRRPGSHSRGDDLCVRQTQRTWDMTLPEELRAARIEQDEPRISRRQRLVDVPAVGLESEEPLEMRQG